MSRSAPRIAWPLVVAIAELDEPGLSFAELWRRLCVRAAELDLPYPSYEQTRVLARRERRIRAMPGINDLALDVMLKTRGAAEARAVAAERLHEKNAAREAVARERAWRPPGESR